MSEETELAWAAGFFDGEGSVYVSNRKEYIRKNGKRQCGSVVPCISVHQNETETLKRFKSAVNIGYINGPYKSTGVGVKPYYQYGVQSRVAFSAIADSLWPYLSNPKKEQFKRVYEQVRSAMKQSKENLRELPV